MIVNAKIILIACLLFIINGCKTDKNISPISTDIELYNTNTRIVTRINHSTPNILYINIKGYDKEFDLKTPITKIICKEID